MYDFCLSVFKQCLAEIKLRNIGGMILIDFPRMSLPKRKLLHEEIVSAGKTTFNDGDFLGFSRLLLYEMYIPRNIGHWRHWSGAKLIFQNHLRGLQVLDQIYRYRSKCL